jgi:hypothetical protein
VANIDELHGTRQLRIFFEEVPDERGKFLALGLGAPGVAVARQIHQEERIVDGVKIQAARFTRRARHHGQLATEQLVEQRRLPDVGSSREGHLRARFFGKLILGVGGPVPVDLVPGHDHAPTLAQARR